jgi:hypothetical protein
VAGPLTGARRETVEGVIAQAGLESVIRRKAGAYSMGMRLRLGIAAALPGDPPVLILDEPFNGKDPEGIVWMRGYLRALAGQGRRRGVQSRDERTGRRADHLVVSCNEPVFAADFDDGHVNNPEKAVRLRELLHGYVEGPWRTWAPLAERCSGRGSFMRISTIFVYGFSVSPSGSNWVEPRHLELDCYRIATEARRRPSVAARRRDAEPLPSA